jgi:trans-aconitate methyltransferase
MTDPLPAGSFGLINGQWAFVLTGWPTMPTIRAMLTYYACEMVKPGPKTVLDIGGGSGDVTTSMAQRWKVSVLDLDKSKEYAALTTWKAHEFINCDIFEVKKHPELRKRKWDVCVMEELIEHMPSFKEASRLVKTALTLGDFVVITTPCERDWAASADPFTNPDHKLHFTDSLFKETLRAGGGRIILADRVRMAGLSHYFAVITKKKRALLHHPPEPTRMKGI